MEIRYDKIADAIYIYLCPKDDYKNDPIEETIPVDADFSMNVDVTKGKKLFGIEILSASKHFNIENLKTLIFNQIA